MYSSRPGISSKALGMLLGSRVFIWRSAGSNPGGRGYCLVAIGPTLAMMGGPSCRRRRDGGKYENVRVLYAGHPFDFNSSSLILVVKIFHARKSPNFP